MGTGSSFVQAKVGSCLIVRETNGCYVVSRQDRPMKKVRAATLAGAYAACQGLENMLSHQT